MASRANRKQAVLKAFVVLAVLAVLLAVAGEGQPAYAATITVNTTDDELNSDGDCSLREAIQAANSNAGVDACTAGSGPDSIVFDASVVPGTFTLTIPGISEDANETGDLDITADLTITGAGAASTVIQAGATPGSGIDRVFHIDPNAVGVTVEISDVTIRNGDTTGVGNGGGILNDAGGTLTLNNSTVTGNSASVLAGGIFNNSGTATLKNMIVANQTAGGDCDGTITSAGYNLSSDSTCGFTATGDQQDTNPLLGALANNGGPTRTHALGAGSPAIDTGNPATPGSGGNACEATDQRGVARPQGTFCDIGAFEVAAVNTSVGSDVCVPMNGGLGETGGLETCFSNVTEAGITTVIVSTPCPPGLEPDTGFQIWGLEGERTCYDINTTATFTPPVRVCIKYDPAGLTLEQQRDLTPKRKNPVPPGPTWTTLANITVDTDNFIICGDSDTLSIFTLQLPAPAVGGIAEVMTDRDIRADAAGASGRDYTAPTAAGVAAVALALAAGGWYARRRFLR